jgi:hypothetical protein
VETRWLVDSEALEEAERGEPADGATFRAAH